MGPDRSIRRLLLWWLLLPLAGVLVASATAAYRNAVAIATDAFDRALVDPALVIAQRLRTNADMIELEMPAGVLDALRVDEVDRVYFSIRARDRVITGQSDLAPPPVSPEEGFPVFYDARVAGAPVRVAAIAVPLGAETVTVQVAETRVKRDRMVRKALLAHTVPEAAFLAVALGVVWFGVARGLAPLDKLRAELAARSHLDLRAVSERQAPEEVRPLVRELNNLLARLAGSIDAQQRFVADAAHQLRTPLAALQAQVEAARRLPVPPELASTLDQLLAATRRTAHLARQLLTLAAVDPAAERPFSPEAVDLSQVVQESVAGWVTRADPKQIDLGFELEEAPVSGEPLLLRELAGNLVDNALDYSPAGSTVTLRTGRRHGASFLEVEDNGPGIPEGEREQVFQRFYRLKGSPGEGSGLGLAIVREIAHRHGATASIGVPLGGRGTTVRITFPARRAA
ncbi:MAG TPA: sensor histidine kinase N-terminal domain-containing protein [Burkholderiales bacterium]|nr:sensor histidine kinase N-terminal domain-containing protein [Burkholderiales bacterium]